MVEENLIQKFSLKNVDETRNYFVEEIEQNEVKYEVYEEYIKMSKKYKKVCVILNYIENFLILASTITGCIFIYAFASLVGVPIGTYEFSRGCNTIKHLCNNCSN